MTKREIELASLLLEAASDRFANHVCNDYELPKTWSRSERSALINAIDRWTDPESDAFVSERETLVVDWLAMRYLSTKLMSFVAPVWKPIETAPKDGSWILAVCEGRHQNSGVPWTPAIVKWYEGEWVFDEEDDAVYQPSHWMPLPPNPCEVA